MIHLANDPNANRMSLRPVQGESQRAESTEQRARSRHAWPFLSRHAGRPGPQESQKPVAHDSGS